MTPKGRSVLEVGPIVLPVPASVRELEEKQKKALSDSLEILQKAGVDIDQIPKKELEEGDGEVLKALQTWHSYLDSLQRRQQHKRVDELDDLRLRLEAWRSDMAVKFRMSPSDVMPEHLLVKVAYAAASIRRGKLEREALVGVGVRSGGIDDLESTITSWLEETLDSKGTEHGSNQRTDDSCNKMIIPDEEFKPSKPWQHFVYKPLKKTGLASWESSYDRFTAGEHPQTIAMSPANGRPIQVNTVINHIFDGLASGRSVNLKHLSTLVPFPNQHEWEQLISMEIETEMDVTADPKTSGRDGESFKMADFMIPIMGNVFAAKEYNERTQEEKELFSKWCQLTKCYTAMRRIGFVPQFENSIGVKSETETV